jgi:peptidoglycan/LPS O-acetylase OafA/YrhL
LFADLFLTDWRNLAEEKSYVADAAGIASMAALLIFNDPFSVSHDIIFAGCLFFSFVALFKGKLVNAFFTNAWIVVIGGMCYSIYLLHYALIAFITGISESIVNRGLSYGANFFIQAIIVLPIVIFVSAIYFVLIERPCMDKNWPSTLKTKVVSFFSSPAK